jgi:D-alanyl-D-alanine carboxypeptidase/D-alanyl-D-alanine-endopeptidase (penicillin-binding protein 4)
LNLVTPKQIVNLLSYVERSDIFDYLYASLPIAGVDGSLADRLQKTKAENNLRGKTGFLEGVRSLSGYIYTGDKELVAFSMIVNNFTAPLKLAENLQDLVCIRLANFRRK